MLLQCCKGIYVCGYYILLTSKKEVLTIATYINGIKNCGIKFHPNFIQIYS